MRNRGNTYQRIERAERTKQALEVAARAEYNTWMRSCLGLPSGADESEFNAAYLQYVTNVVEGYERAHGVTVIPVSLEPAEVNKLLAADDPLASISDDVYASWCKSAMTEGLS